MNMAKIEIESAFVEAWTKNQEAHPAWGMKTAEPHSRKKEDGSGYETVGRTFRTVKVSRASGIDLTQFRKGDRVKVWGKEVTETREHEGKKFYDVVVWSDRVELAVARDSDRSPAPQQQSQQEPWAASAPTPQSGGYSDETPF
jgi:single-stranded DNA-binding protein